MGITNMGQILHSVDKYSKFVSLFLFTGLPKFGRRYQEDNLYYDILRISSFCSAWKCSKISFLVIFGTFFSFLNYLYFGIPFSLAEAWTKTSVEEVAGWGWLNWTLRLEKSLRSGSWRNLLLLSEWHQLRKWDWDSFTARSGRKA